MVKRLKLNEKTLREAEPKPGVSYQIFDTEVFGFAARVQASGARTFTIDYRHAGRQRRMTIGRWPEWSVTAARERAKELRRMIDEGQDPLAAKEELREAPRIDPQLTPLAVEGVLRAVMVFGATEVGQHIVPAPAGVAHLPPEIVIARLTAHVDHAIDRRTAAKHLSTRVVQRATVQPRLGLGPEAPVQGRVAHRIEVAHRHVHPEAVVAAPCLEQKDPASGVGAQPVGQDASG